MSLNPGNYVMMVRNDLENITVGMVILFCVSFILDVEHVDQPNWFSFGIIMFCLGRWMHTCGLLNNKAYYSLGWMLALLSQWCMLGLTWWKLLRPLSME